jgi:erythromycin esterase
MAVPTPVAADMVQKAIAEVARPWGEPQDMDALLDRIGEAKYVLLGEASHGTHEYYLWRSRLSQRLITEKNFTFIAVEGDWPDCYSVNRYIKQYPDAGRSATEVLRDFKRWPTWMWANQEIVQLAEWLREYNENRGVEDRVGFYGLDVYSLWDSIRAVVEYLDEVDPEAAQQARQAYQCFEPYGEDTNAYAYRTAFVPESCEAEVIKVLRLLREKAPTYGKDFEASFDAEQNARTVVNAEQYYRTMIGGDAASWNIRDNHMVETLTYLMQRYGESAKAIVWAHNTHVGDARYTNMRSAGMVNVGQLAREAQGEDNVVLVGFGSYAGTVIAGQYWDAPMEVMEVPSARRDSWENLMHTTLPPSADKLILSRETVDHDGFWDVRGHRAIGVVYNPERDMGNYVPTLLPSRYDAFIYLDRTKALRPLHLDQQPDEDYPETFPWGV